MLNLLKDRYNRLALEELAEDIQLVYRDFQVEEFLDSIFDETWNELELKDRVYRISKKLGCYLPADYQEAIRVIDQVIPHYGTWVSGFAGFFPIFIELYGQDEANWETSMAALARYTPYASSEIAVRPFILNNEERMMSQMYEWSNDEDELVRRLASEGCRPQLPWAQSLPNFKNDPSPILPIIKRLRADKSTHVQKSVANNLNDISKTHPELVTELAKKWYGENEVTDWIVKHGCRTLLKKGTQDALIIFGYNDGTSILVENFSLDVSEISIGESVTFSFVLFTTKATKVRIEYAIDFVKKNGKKNRKIFKISETSLKRDERKSYEKTHSFIDRSTRQHNEGVHTISLITNGIVRESLDFRLES